MRLLRPNAEAVAKVERKLMENPRTIDGDRALKLLFEQYPENTDVALVLPKVATLNSLYSTGILDIVSVARGIASSRIDEHLRVGDLKAVNVISRIKFRGGKRNCYSFATKYCSFHRPDRYPMFDRNVENALKAYKRRSMFADFLAKDLRDYEKYLNILGQFRAHYSLNGVSVRALDKFLWKVGKGAKRRA